MKMGSAFLSQNGLALLALAVALGFGIHSTLRQNPAQRIVFVDTQRLMTGFKEANEIDKELRAEETKWRGSLKVLEDSIKAFMDTMSVRYDKADLNERKKLQDELSLRNQQANNFERANIRRMQELNQTKMAKVFEKVNLFMKEYGKLHGYPIIFGTVNGSILYGENTAADITYDVVEQLNKRYE